MKTVCSHLTYALYGFRDYSAYFGNKLLLVWVPEQDVNCHNSGTVLDLSCKLLAVLLMFT